MAWREFRVRPNVDADQCLHQSQLGSVACSADGTKLAALASDIYGYYTSWVSTNSGATWTATSLPNTTDVIGKLLLSADGTKLVASDTAGFMYTSTDLGNTWISNTVPTGFLLPIALSADGTKMVAEGDTSTNDVIFTSTNSGTTWVSNNIPVNSALFGATSADGIRMVVTGMTIQGPSYVFTSTNSGATWSDGVPAGGNLLYSVAFSADGTKLVTGGEAPSETPFMLTSTNSGATWTSNSLPSLSAMWKSFALSADGNTLVAVATSVNLDLKLEGHILTSTNLGATGAWPMLPLNAGAASLARRMGANWQLRRLPRLHHRSPSAAFTLPEPFLRRDCASHRRAVISSFRGSSLRPIS